MKSPYRRDLGQSTPSDFACRRNRATLPSSGAGMVRRIPILASSIIRAATIPVSSESWAFQSSARTGGRNPSSKQPSSLRVTSCSGSGRLAPPRADSRPMRLSPISLSSNRFSSAVPLSTDCWTPT